MTCHIFYFDLKIMRKFMHRKNPENSEIDPMDAPARTVFFKKSKPIETGTIDDFHSDDEPEIINMKANDSEKTESVQISFDNNENLDETDKKLIFLKKEIEIANKSHEITKQRLLSKSQSLKKAKSTLTQTQKKTRYGVILRI